MEIIIKQDWEGRDATHQELNIKLAKMGAIKTPENIAKKIIHGKFSAVCTK